MDPGIEMPVRFLDWELFECKRVAFPSTLVSWFVQEAVETLQRRILLTKPVCILKKSLLLSS
jgi:hypothetical protein